MPAGEQVALEPALAHVLAEHLHDAPVAGRGHRRSAAPLGQPRRSVTSNSAPRRLDAVSSGPKTRKLSAGCASMTSRRNAPSTRVASASSVPGVPNVDGVVAEVGQGEVAQEQSAVGVRVRAHPPVALGASAARSGTSLPFVVEQLFRAVAAHPLFEHAQSARDSSRTSVIGT